MKKKKTKTYKYDFSFNFRVYEYPKHGGFGIHETHYKGKRIIWVDGNPQSIVGWTPQELRAELRNRAAALKADIAAVVPLAATTSTAAAGAFCSVGVAANTVGGAGCSCAGEKLGHVVLLIRCCCSNAVTLV